MLMPCCAGVPWSAAVSAALLSFFDQRRKAAETAALQGLTPTRGAMRVATTAKQPSLCYSAAGSSSQGISRRLAAALGDVSMGHNRQGRNNVVSANSPNHSSFLCRGDDSW